VAARPLYIDDRRSRYVWSCNSRESELYKEGID